MFLGYAAFAILAVLVGGILLMGRPIASDDVDLGSVSTSWLNTRRLN